jgi:hypothetical protein
MHMPAAQSSIFEFDELCRDQQGEIASSVCVFQVGGYNQFSDGKSAVRAPPEFMHFAARAPPREK